MNQEHADQAIPQMTKLKRVGRLVVVESVCHQLSGQEPTAESPRFSVELGSAQLPFKKVVIVGDEWQRIDVGWIEGEASQVLVVNEEGRFLQGRPTPEQQERIDLRLVDVSLSVGIGEGIMVVPPSQHARFRPKELRKVAFRCPTGRARCTVIVFPA